MHVSELQTKHITELLAQAEQMGIENANRLRKQDLVFTIVRKLMENGQEFICSGTLETLPDGYGFLRSAATSYLACPDDIYVSPHQIRRFNLHTGDTIEGTVRVPKNDEKYFALVRLDSVNGDHPEKCRHKILFENLTPLFPEKQLKLEQDNLSAENITGRIIDLISPIAHAITANYPDVELIVLLIDERPEEVTEMTRSVRGEVVASTFDEPAQRHVQVAEMVIEKAKRMVEHKKDVVILLDSITRLARAYNTVVPTSGKILTGGVDANALHRPKRFFGAARNTEEGGSLTIIATALVDTGSRMDDVIFEEFKGTGNMELNLERRLAEKRVFPAININKSGTRREELLVPADQLQKMWALRRVIHPMDDIEAAEFLLDKIKKTKNNDDFFDSMRGGSTVGKMVAKTAVAAKTDSPVAKPRIRKTKTAE